MSASDGSDSEKWSPMRFKDQTVWIRVDGSGRPIVDSTGRAEMKYREGDQKSYRPSSRNLVTLTGEAPPPASTETAAKPARKPAPRATPAMTASPSDAIHLWTDGACTGNPGPMGIGIVLVSPNGRREHSEFLGEGTNNIAELVAIERGLELAATLGLPPKSQIRIYTDSQYSIGVLSLGWKAKANVELVARMRKQLGSLTSVQMIKVAGHAGVPLNERCDELAREGILTRKSRTQDFPA